MYSIDFVKKAVAYKQEGHTFRQLQEAFGVKSQTYYQWVRKLGSGHYDTKTKQVRSRKIDRELLRQAVAENPNAYLHELAKPFGCTPHAVFYMLKEMNITLKKDLRLLRKIRGETRRIFSEGFSA